MGADLRGGVWALRPGGAPHSTECNLDTAAGYNLGAPALGLLPGAPATPRIKVTMPGGLPKPLMHNGIAQARQAVAA